jgi:hypothetical protein
VAHALIQPLSVLRLLNSGSAVRPDWFFGIVPAARRGAAKLHGFARRPFSVTL